jgi:hypothetical protein
VALRERAQAFGSLFWRNIALCFGEQFKPHHEFAHRCRTEQRRIGMGVQMPVRMGRAIGGTLVEAEGVGERDLEQVIVARCQSFEDVRQTRAFLRRQVAESADMPAADDHGFEGPDRPERNQRDKMVVDADKTLFTLEFEGQIIREQ